MCYLTRERVAHIASFPDRARRHNGEIAVQYALMLNDVTAVWNVSLIARALPVVLTTDCENDGVCISRWHRLWLDSNELSNWTQRKFPNNGETWLVKWPPLL